MSERKVVEKIIAEWKTLWQERLDDKIRAESIATDNYYSISIEKGTIIHATKDYKVLNLKEIIKQHEIKNPEIYVSPNPYVGGWGKFLKINKLNKGSKKKNRKNFFNEKKINPQQLKKCGRGWLHK